MHITPRFLLPLVLLVAIPTLSPAAPRLKVSDDKHFIVKEDGSPFFYLGDTAWELFHRLNRDEAERYLKNRADKQFTVIQAVILAELDGLNDPNPYGQKALNTNDPTKPNEDYFKHVDFIVNKAEELGLFIGMLPTWGSNWNKPPGQGGIFTTQNAGPYGEFLGKRYKDKPIIWILGGDRPVENDNHRAILRTMAEGLRRGDGGTHLITFHPPGGQGSSKWLHNEPWLDFNMRQNGHVPEFTGRYDQTRADYDRTDPVKPVIDGEPIYEDHPVSFRPKELGHSVTADVRRPLYWDLFGGACGHTYGHHSVWQMYAKGRNPINGPLMPWTEALDQPGAAQMQHGRRLIESRPVLSRIPDDTIIATDTVPTSVPGAGTRHYAGTRDREGTYAFVYIPVGRPFSVKMDVIKGEKAKAWWFNPLTGKADSIGEFSTQGERRFTPPDNGELLDWVLVLDDASKLYPPPGTAATRL
jgi:hypothetical protein